MIKGDARKYPERNELTGGFAGGELGLKTFVEAGDVPIAGAPARLLARQCVCLPASLLFPCLLHLSPSLLPADLESQY